MGKLLGTRVSTAVENDRTQPSPVVVAVIGFLTVSVLLLLLGRLALSHQVGLGREAFEPGSGWFGQWVRYDGNWYYGIAADGYGYVSGGQRDVAFWPSYPLAMRALGYVTHDEFDAGLIITWISGFAVIVMLAKWCEERMTRVAAIAAVITLLVFPYSWYLHWAVYGDAMFAAFALGAFLLLERDRPVLAGCAGAIAAAGRPMGLAVAAGLFVLALERRDAFTPMAAGASSSWRRALVWLRFPRSVQWRRLRVKDLGVLIALLGPISYMLFLWRTEGTPLAFADAESAPGWGHRPGLATWLKLGVGNAILDMGLERETLSMLLHGALSVGAVLLIPRVIRRFGWGYGIYTIILVGIPVVSSKDFYGLGRYMLAAFPVVAVVGEWLAGRDVRVRTGIWTVSGLLFAVIAYTYARGLYVA